MLKYEVGKKYQGSIHTRDEELMQDVEFCITFTVTKRTKTLITIASEFKRVDGERFQIYENEFNGWEQTKSTYFRTNANWEAA